MPKYRPGETSTAVIKKKNAITKSMLKKAELIDSISSFDVIYSSLSVKRESISEGAVHDWSDEKLGVTSYSWNSAHTKHNAKPLKKLLKAISSANDRLRENQDKTNKDRHYENNADDKTTSRLKEENEYLKKSLAEVYRAYMHLIAHYREDKEIDATIKELILDQARILGQQRIWEVK